MTAAPALLPSLHALVEKWRELAAESAWHPYYRTTWTNCADELEALLSRAATTQVAFPGWEFSVRPDPPYEPLAFVRKPNGVAMALTKGDFLYELVCMLAVATPSQPVAPVVPDGWQLVPKEITVEMDIAVTGPGNNPLKSAFVDYHMGTVEVKRIWKQMLAAAPHPAQPSSEQPVMSKSMAKRIAAQREQEPNSEVWTKEEIDAGKKRAAELFARFGAQEPTAADELRAMIYAPRDGTKIELFIRHQSYYAAKRAGDTTTRWEGFCIGHWTDHNGGGWTWSGHAGTPEGWREIARERKA